MELFLNLFWLALAATVATVFVRQQSGREEQERLPYAKALLALGCVIVLLFPFVSASDDLHPTQAIFEDSSKRVQKSASPALHGSGTTNLLMLLTLASLAALCLLPTSTWIRRRYISSPATLDGMVLAAGSRAPPAHFC